LQREFRVPVFYASQDRPFLTRATATKGLRGWLGKQVPEEGILVLLRGLLEEAAPEAVEANHCAVCANPHASFALDIAARLSPM
jgi:hypothetical protein